MGSYVVKQLHLLPLHLPGHDGSEGVAGDRLTSQREEDREARLAGPEVLQVRHLLCGELNSAVRVNQDILVEDMAAGTRLQLVGALLALVVAENLLPCLSWAVRTGTWTISGSVSPGSWLLAPGLPCARRGRSDTARMLRRRRGTMATPPHLSSATSNIRLSM